MYRWPEADDIKGSFYQAASSLVGILGFFDGRPASTKSIFDTEGSVKGRCYVCQKDTSFRVDRPEQDKAINWRETLVCLDCGLTNRWRSSLHIFEQQVQPQKDDLIFVTEAVTPLFQELHSRYPESVGSEYFVGEEPGAMIDTPGGPVRNEDVTSLSFGDRSLHAVLSFDVLEHVPDYKAALREFYRVLATGEQLIFSVPFLFGEKTRRTARIDSAGEIEHLCKPVYHGDPLSGKAVLCFYEFGIDLLQDIRDAGFQQSFVICYVSAKWAYLEPQVIFIGRKKY